MSLSLSFMVNTPAAQNTIPDGCGTPDVACNNLFENSAGLFTISNIQAASDIPIFANPILYAQVRIERRPSAAVWRIYAPFYSFQPDGFCKVIIVGLADANDQYIPYYEVKASDSTFTVKLFGFCRDNNLPATSGEGNRFPDDGFRNTVSGISDFQALASEDKPDSLANIVRRATSTDNLCLLGNGLSSLLTQFAVFILYAPSAERETVWRKFVSEANNPLYENPESRSKIYCLLAEVEGGIPTPQPTTTPTPTPTSTTPPILFATETPTPTNTPIPFLDLAASPLPIPIQHPPLTIGQVLFLGFVLVVGGMLLAIVWLSLSPRRRFLWTIGLVAVLVLVFYFLLKQPIL